jgi:phosphoketolase
MGANPHANGGLLKRELKLPNYRDYAVEVPQPAVSAAHIKQQFRDKLLEHTRYVREHGEDMPEIQGWVWPYKTGTEAGD